MMASKNTAVFFLLVVSAATTSALFPTFIGYYNVTDPKFQYLGSFAVEQYNKKGESHLYFKEVLFVAEFFKPGEFLTPPDLRDKYYGTQLAAINCSQSGAVGNYTACIVNLVNTTDPTTGLSYVLKSLYATPGIFMGWCNFF